MKITFEILRRKTASDKPYTIEVALEAEDTTVAEALDRINAEQLADDPVRWECSCKQKKCGACAMLINGRPRLACDTRLSEFAGGKITLAPLRKFPTVCDLVIDRSVMTDNLAKLGAWFENESVPDKTNTAYEASRCLQCGCCLEVCPNFYAGGSFYGTAALAPAARIIGESGKDDYERMRKEYYQHIYKGCGKSLACRDICPAGIDWERLLVNTNAAAVWKRL